MAKIKGNKKNNKLKGKGHDDKIKGLDGDDQLTGNGGNDKLIGGKGNDTLDGGIGDDKLLGGLGNDTMFGGDGNDTMDGGDGDDFMEAGLGNDFFIGGAGIDTVSYANSAFGISLEFALQTNTDDGLHDGFSGVENIDGSQFSDSIYGDGANNHLRGLGANDYLKGGDGNDILDGGEGDDQLYFDNGADQLIGGNGFDSIVYEKATSGAGIDLATGVGSGSAAGDTFSGIERVFATNFNDTVTGGAAAEAFFGGSGDDNLYGGDNNDTLFGGIGLDNLYGGEGDDRLCAGRRRCRGRPSVRRERQRLGRLLRCRGCGERFTSVAARVAGKPPAIPTTASRTSRARTMTINSSAGLDGKAFGGWGDDQHLRCDNGERGTEVLRGERGDDDLYRRLAPWTGGRCSRQLCP